MTAGDDSGRLELLTKRDDVLRRICESPAHKRDLVEDLDHSRSTLDRAVRALEEADLVERRDGLITATVAGRLAVERLESFRAGLEDAVDAESVLAPLGPDADLSMEAVAGGETIPATEPTPYRPLERVHDELAAADRYRAVLPQLDAPRHVRLLYEHVVTDGNPAELVVPPELLESLREEFPRQMAAMADQEGFRLLVTEDPPAFALGLFGSGEEATIGVVVFTDTGVHGVLRNEAPAAVRWGEDLYARVRDGATDRTDSLRADADGGVAVVDGSADALGRSLPVALEREGFVRVDSDYFRDEPVNDPVTAWRAGLSLAEVNTGYAVERARPSGREGERADASDRPDGERSHETDSAGMTDELLADLVAGTDCAVVGPPGSGKSTLCKRVACEWYDDDRGPVFYREQGRGRPFESVAALSAVVDAVDGHTLVVVEDAVRPEGNAVFEAVEALADREDVSFLFDSRETEWFDPPEELGSVADLRVRTMPPLDETDCERIVAHFERTLGRDVDVPAGRLLEEVRDEAAGDDAAPSEVLLLLHRLATYADPLADGQTSLEETVADLYDDIADDDTALSVCVLACTLTAAGIGVDRSLLYAVADEGAFGAVDDALDRLEGRVVFARPDGSYRTVHESWAVAFLEHLLAVEGEAGAAERFGGAVSDLLALADEPWRRTRIATHLDDQYGLAAIADAPGEWVAETVEAVYTLGRERPKLAPLFGDGDRDSVTLPAATPAAVAERRPVWLGRAFLARGFPDRARRAFERLPETATERLLGLSRVASERGDHDAALELADRCLAALDDDTVEAARARLAAGRALQQSGAIERARTRLQAALEAFEAVGDRRRTAAVLSNIGELHGQRGAYEEAAEYHRRALERYRRLGDRSGEARSLSSLGSVARARGEHAEAREYYARSLDIAREIGNRGMEAKILGSIAGVAAGQGNRDRAEEYTERALDIAREIDNRRMEARFLGNIGILAERRGNYDRAREYIERSLEVTREIGATANLGIRLNNRGLVAVRQADHELARESFERGREIGIENDMPFREVNGLNGLGHVARMCGEYERARDYHQQALELTRDLGHRRREADSANKLGIVALRMREYDTAREYFRAGLEIAREIDIPREEIRGLLGLGRVALEQAEFERAREHLEAALEATDSTDDPILRAQVRLAGGRLALARGDVERAREAARDARRSFEEMGTPQWAARGERLLGQVAAADGSPSAARDHFEAALETFEEVGAAADVLGTLADLVETCRDADRWRERLRTAASDAPDAAVERHRDRLDALLEE